MTSVLVRGALAGATGTAVLSATTYLDMALPGRPASRVPERAVAELLKRAARAEDAAVLAAAWIALR